MSGRSSAGSFRGRGGRVLQGGKSITSGRGRGRGLSDYTDDYEHEEEDAGLEALDILDGEHEIGSPRSVTHHDSNASDTVLTHSSHKVWISITDDNSRFTNHKAVTSITKNLKNMFMGPWAQWTDVEIEHKDRLFAEFQEELMGGPQPSSEVFKNNHIRKGKGVEGVEPVFVDEKSRITYETYMGYLVEKYGPNVEDHPKHDPELWERAVGRRNKGRSYGSSTSTDPCFVLTGIPSTPSTGSSYAGQQDEVQKLVQKIVEIEEQREKEKEEILKEKEEMQEREERLLKQLHDSNQEMKVREERLQKEVNDSKALAEDVRKELSEKYDNLLKYLPNFPLP